MKAKHLGLAITMAYMSIGTLKAHATDMNLGEIVIKYQGAMESLQVREGCIPVWPAQYPCYKLVKSKTLKIVLGNRVCLDWYPGLCLVANGIDNQTGELIVFYEWLSTPRKQVELRVLPYIGGDRDVSFVHKGHLYQLAWHKAYVYSYDTERARDEKRKTSETPCN